MLRSAFLPLRLLWFVAILGTGTSLLAQDLEGYNRNGGVLTAPNGVRYTYDFAGIPDYANPQNPIPGDLNDCNGTRGWISYALTHQLTRDQELYTKVKGLTKKSSLCGVMSAVTLGAGYYMICPDKRVKDMQIIPEYDLRYLILVNSDKETIYVAEYLAGKVVEVHKVYVGRRWFERDNEVYENPIGNASCSNDPPPYEPPTAVIVAKPEGGPAPLTVQLDGTESFDTDGVITAYSWDLGNGTTSTDSMPETRYASPGTYTVSLEVTDNDGLTNKTSRDLTVDDSGVAFEPPVAVILADKVTGTAPFTAELDGRNSYDPDGGGIVAYRWTISDGQMFESPGVPSLTLNDPGTYTVKLWVADDEGDTATTAQILTVVAAPVVTTVDSCWMMFYTLRACGGRTDTVEQTPVRVSCPAPPQPRIVYTDCCCGLEADSTKPKAAPRRLQIAGGPVFHRMKGQLTEYGLGVNGQLRYRFGREQRLGVLVDLTVFPERRATPLDDRPYKWSSIRDSIDVETGLPLVWWRGTSRGTASLALGIDIQPWPWFYAQAIGGVERTFQQTEISDARKSPDNRFVGFDLEIFFAELRIGFRKDHLEIYGGARLLQENRPFTLIPPNTLGGSHNASFDKTYHAGINIYY